jgi:hypothetical protein
MLHKEYKDFNEAYFNFNKNILVNPSIINYMENTRAILEDVFIIMESTQCDQIDLAPLGYSPKKWGHLVKTYIDQDQLKSFFHLCEISKGISIGYDFKRKETGNGSCMREIILTRESRKKPWQKVRVIWRATELQKRWAADLILLHHLISKIPNAQIEQIEFYIISAYQSGMYVIPLIGPVFGVDLKQLDPKAHPYWKIIRYREQKYYQPDSPRQKLSPAQRMQDVAEAIREGREFTPITYKDFELEV